MAARWAITGHSMGGRRRVDRGAEEPRGVQVDLGVFAHRVAA